ncbi:MAG TPA: hypothetical protein VF980_04945 [Thermoanaerobaculia bacterium]
MRSALAFTALLTCAGCATAINGRFQEVPVESFPSGVKVNVACGAAPVDGGVTPARVKLERRATDCRLKLTKDGYEPREIAFERQRSKAMQVNKVVAAPLGIIVGTAALLSSQDFIAGEDAAQGGFEAGMELGAAPMNQIDKHYGGAYKQVPAKVFAVLIRQRQAQ